MGFLFIGVGVFALLCTYFKPSFYWESRKAKRARKLFGDIGTTVTYYIIGTVIMVIGILEVFNIISIN